MDSSFLAQKISAKFQRGHPQRGRQTEVKKAIFDQCLAISQKRYKIGTYTVVNANKNLYVLHQMVLFPVTLSDPNYPNPHF